MRAPLPLAGEYLRRDNTRGKGENSSFDDISDGSSTQCFSRNVFRWPFSTADDPVCVYLFLSRIQGRSNNDIRVNHFLQNNRSPGC